MHKLVFSLAVLMGTVLVAQIPEEIPLEPPANRPNVAAETETDTAIPAVEVEALDPGKVGGSRDETPPAPVAEAVEAVDVVQPETAANDPAANDSVPLVLRPNVKWANTPNDANDGAPTPIELSGPVDTNPDLEPRYERSLADRVVPQSNPRRDRVRLNAAKRAARRRFRIATMKWLNYSKIRPTAGATPTTSYYTPSWRSFELDTSAYWDEFGLGLPPTRERSGE